MTRQVNPDVIAVLSVGYGQMEVRMLLDGRKLLVLPGSTRKWSNLMGIRVPPRPPETPEELQQQIRDLEASILRTQLLRAVILAAGAVLIVVFVVVILN